MKHRLLTILTLTATAIVASNASAATVFNDDFASFAPFDPTANPVVIWDDQTGKWLTSGAATHFAVQETVGLETNSSGKSRGLAYVWDPTTTTGLVADSAYTLTIDIVNQYADSTLEVFVYEGVRDDTGTVNTYKLDLLSDINSPLVHEFNGTGALNLLDSDTWTGGVGATGTVTLNFAYDGTDDVVLVMNQRTAVSGTKRTTFDNVILANSIPEPSSMAFLALSGIALLLRRRR